MISEAYLQIYCQYQKYFPAIPLVLFICCALFGINVIITGILCFSLIICYNFGNNLVEHSKQRRTTLQNLKSLAQQILLESDSESISLAPPRQPISCESSIEKNSIVDPKVIPNIPDTGFTLCETEFNCKVCNCKVKFHINDLSTFLSKTPQENFCGVALSIYRVRHQVGSHEFHVNSVLVDEKGLFRAFIDAYSEFQEESAQSRIQQNNNDSSGLIMANEKQNIPMKEIEATVNNDIPLEIESRSNPNKKIEVREHVEVDSEKIRLLVDKHTFFCPFCNQCVELRYEKICETDITVFHEENLLKVLMSHSITSMQHFLLILFNKTGDSKAVVGAWMTKIKLNSGEIPPSVSQMTEKLVVTSSEETNSIIVSEL